MGAGKGSKQTPEPPPSGSATDDDDLNWGVFISEKLNSFSVSLNRLFIVKSSYQKINFLITQPKICCG